MRTTLALLALSLAACSSPRARLPEIASLYEDAALDEIRNPVIVIHGILGARLEQTSTKKVVWGAFTSDGIDPETRDGARAMALSLEPPATATSFDPRTADVRATGPLEKLQLSFLFQLLSVNVYADIIRALGAGGYTDAVVGYPKYADDHFTCHSFFYDWRRDNVENAIRLGEFIHEKRAEIDAKAREKCARLRREGNNDAAERITQWLERGYRFDIVAHSMGGLIARYYLRYGATDLPADGSRPAITWAGGKDIDRLIVVGTPNFGSIDALRTLVQGFRPAFILPYYEPAVLGTMPALYQLLPRVRHRLILGADGKPVDVDFMDPAVWEANGWGMFADGSDRVLQWLLPDAAAPEARRAAARRCVTWCLERARRFHDALDAPEPSSPSYLQLFAADAEPTLARAHAIPDENGKLRLDFDGDDLYAPGDLTVARYSAIADERFGSAYVPWLQSPIPWTNITFLSDDHIGLTHNPHFVNNMLFVLLERPPARR